MAELLWYGFVFSGRAQQEVSLFKPVPDGETLYLSKKPPDTRRISRVFLADERWFVICMLRDPRSVASSKHAHFPDVYFSGFRRWLEYEAVSQQLVGHPRFLMVHYEALLTDPDAVQAEILRKFPWLKQQRSFSAFPEGADAGERARVAMHGVRAIDPARIAGWQKHLPRVKHQVERYPQILESLIKHGYEPDESWLECLQSIEPAGETYKEDRAHVLRRKESDLRYWWKTRQYLKNLRG